MNFKDFQSGLNQRQHPMPWPGHWIARKWVPGAKGSTLKASVSPNRNTTLVEFSSERAQLEQAIISAVAAKKIIASIPLKERLGYLKKFRQVLADYQDSGVLALRIEAGKPAAEAREDVEAALRYLDWVAEHGQKIREDLIAPAKLGPTKGAFELMPIGVTAAYLPFSTPLTSFVFYFAASMLAGCPLIVFTGHHAILTGLMVGYLDEMVGLPEGVLNIYFGNFSSFKELLASQHVAAVLYTGSREHCDLIRRENRSHLGRQMVLQSGGKNAVIIHSSADLDVAVDVVMQGLTRSSSQLCTSTSRVFVYRNLMDQFCEKIKVAITGMNIGPTDVDDKSLVHMGPLYSQKAVDKFLRFQTMAHREAKQTLLWGKTVENSGSKGFFVTPGVHIVDRFDNISAYQGNVLFGPDLAVYEYDVLDDAIEKINTTDASFAVSFVGDEQILLDRRHLFLAPNLLINKPTVESEATLPLAGRLQAGHHRFHGPGIALYLTYPQVVA